MIFDPIQVLQSDIGGFSYHQLPSCLSLPKATMIPWNESNPVPTWNHHKMLSAEHASMSIKGHRQVSLPITVYHVNCEFIKCN